MISQVRGSLFVRPWRVPVLCPIAIDVRPRDEKIAKLTGPTEERNYADSSLTDVRFDSGPCSDSDRSDDASVIDSDSMTEADPPYNPAREDCFARINSCYRTRRATAQLRHCTVHDSVLNESKSIMGNQWDDLVTLVDASQRAQNATANELINSVVKFVNCSRVGLTTTFTPDLVRKTLHLEGDQEALTGTPEETSCTALCETFPNEVQRRLQQYADYGLGDLKNDAVYQEAIQLLRLAKPGHPVSTQRLLVEKDALRVHMQCIEVLVGPDPYTVCKKMFNIENIQLPEALLKGIVLPESCGSCGLVVQLPNCRGSVLTPPATEPEHIAAYLVLALRYTGEELLGLLEQWHYDKTGLVLHPEALFPKLAPSVSQEITGTSGPNEPGVFYAQYDDECDEDEGSWHSSAGTDTSDWCEDQQY
jgi:hypothetical protein